MTTASTVLWQHQGSPMPPGVEPHAGRCWICATEMDHGVRVEKWAGSSFTGQNRVRAPAATHTCAACVWAMAGKPPDTLRMTSHLWAEGEGYQSPNKGGKPAMRAFLRHPHAGAWFAAIADSGQKHVVPWTPVNPAGTKRGRVLFEEAMVAIGDWATLDAMMLLLTAGATKEEIGRGDYGPRAWQLCAATIDGFESEHGRKLRGGSWFELCLFLAQRDEAIVAERMDREKVARAEKKAREKERTKAAKPQKREKASGKTQRVGKGAIADGDGGGAARHARGVPARGGEPAETLGPVAGSATRGAAHVDDAGGVAHVALPIAATGGAEQLGLFGAQEPGGSRRGGKRRQ